MRVSLITKNLLTSLIKQGGVYETKIFTEWAEIVGLDIANISIPFKITNQRIYNKHQKCLHLKVSGSSAALLLSYQKCLIIEKISMYLGINYIDKISFVNDSNYFIENQKKELDIIKNIDKEDNCLITKQVNFVNDIELKEALQNLGENIFCK